MSVELLRKRYLAIVKESLSFLKQEGFQKKGNKYICERDDLIFFIYPYVGQPTFNTATSYWFTINWEVCSYDPDLIHLYSYTTKKEQKDGFLMSGCLQLRGFGQSALTDQDPEDFDERYVREIQKEIREFVLPLFASIHSFDDVIALAERELSIERNERRLFGNTNLEVRLKIFYAAKGWKNKLIDIGEQDVKTSHPMLLDYAKETNAKYLEYVEKYKQK